MAASLRRDMDEVVDSWDGIRDMKSKFHGVAEFFS